MAEPLIDSPAPARAARGDSPVNVVCEFCECKLSRHGEVLKRGPKATAMMKLDDDNAELRERVATLEREKGELVDQLAARPPQVGTPPALEDGDPRWI